MMLSSLVKSKDKSPCILSCASFISWACVHAVSSVTGFTGSFSSPRRYNIKCNSSPFSSLQAHFKAADTSSTAQRSSASCMSKDSGCTPACCHLAKRSIRVSAFTHAGLCVGVERMGNDVSNESIST